MRQRHLPHVLSLSLIAALSGSADAWAMGFGRVHTSATLGAPLDLRVPLRVESAEHIGPECVSAEVTVGDNTLSRNHVIVSLEGGASGTAYVRVRTTTRIEEPVVGVAVSAGCDARISRRFTLFADPPGITPTLPPAPLDLPSAETVATGAAAAHASSASPSATGDTVAAPTAARRATAAAAPAHATATTPVPRHRDARSAAVVEARRARAAARAWALKADPRAARVPPAVTAKRQGNAGAAPAAPVAAEASTGTGTGAARLRLDAPSVTLVADRAAEAAAERRLAELAAVRAAVGAAQAAASAASSRVGSMEATLAALKKESQANREAVAQLRKSLNDADERGRWAPWLLAAVAALLGVALWLYSRLRRVEQERQQAWWNSAQVSPTPAADAAPAPAVAAKAPAPAAVPAREEPARAELPPVVLPAPAPLPPAAPAPAPAPAPLASGEARTTFASTRGPVATGARHMEGPLVPSKPPAAAVVTESHRDVSIEELLDVEQQAEFFVVLGQDEAAVDLLMGHLRSTGGASPLPYLKLLEIYHRRGDQTSYERMRRRFNERFNAHAPEWSTGLQSGRSLEDYPEVMQRIQQHWPHPVDAMADLQTCLFRTDHHELFDLPAYRDVLLLYTLARDLHEVSHHDAPSVDVLLPIGHGLPAAKAAVPAFVDTGASAYLAPEVDKADAIDPGLTFTLESPQPTAPAPLNPEEPPPSGFGGITLHPQPPKGRP